jgi:hypothetical protein
MEDRVTWKGSQVALRQRFLPFVLIQTGRAAGTWEPSQHFLDDRKTRRRRRSRGGCGGGIIALVLKMQNRKLQ